MAHMAQAGQVASASRFPLRDRCGEVSKIKTSVLSAPTIS